MHLSEQEIVRRQAKEELEKLGIDPYPADLYERTHLTEEIREGFNEDNSKDFESISVAGRIMSRRIMGSASFAEIQDESGRIQIYLRKSRM